MSSLRPDRLPTEGQAPTSGTPATLAAAFGWISRRATGTAKVKASNAGSTQRRGKLSTGSASDAPTAATAGRTRSARTATAKAATAAAERTAEAPAAADASAEASAARPVRRPTPYPRPVVDAVADAAPPTPQRTVLAAAAAVGTEIPAVEAPAVEAPAVDAHEALVDAAPRRIRIWHRRPPSVARRPALYLAAALVGALGVGAVSTAGPSALAGAATVGSSVSVAEQLGITADSTEILEAQAPDRLGELVASRAERDAEQAAAAQEQRHADKKAAEKKRAAAAAAAEAARPKAVLPVEGGRLTSGYGARWGTLHPGIDIAAPMHTPEYAVMDGVVLEAGPASGFGLVVCIQHENGDVTLYGHMDQILVQAGQVVRAGDTIALLGNRGQSTGPHLHFEVHQGGLNGAKIDPIPWLRDRGLDI